VNPYVQLRCADKNVKKNTPGVMAHTCNPSTQEAEAGRSPVQGQPGLHIILRHNLSQNQKNTQIHAASLTESIHGLKAAQGHQLATDTCLLVQ
jgi:hypothetical protein